MTSPPGGQLLDLSPSPTMASLPGSWLLENSGGSTPNHPSGEDSSRAQALVVEGSGAPSSSVQGLCLIFLDETELDGAFEPLLDSLCEEDKWLRCVKHLLLIFSSCSDSDWQMVTGNEAWN